LFVQKSPMRAKVGDELRSLKTLILANRYGIVEFNVPFDTV